MHTWFELGFDRSVESIIKGCRERNITHMSLIKCQSGQLARMESALQKLKGSDFRDKNHLLSIGHVPPKSVLVRPFDSDYCDKAY